MPTQIVINDPSEHFGKSDAVLLGQGHQCLNLRESKHHCYSFHMTII